MIKALLKRFRKYRKSKYFSSPLFHTRKKYAFIGVGMHSLSNLYPVIRHYGIDLKYICTHSSSWENEMRRMFPNADFINAPQQIFSDSEVQNVFISADPSSHYQLLIDAFVAGKNVFVEKPPCSSLAALKELINASEGKVCRIGLQRRYWPANKYIVNKIKSALTYNYTFHTGSYFGDDLTELFIHPLDYCITLFGNADILSLSVNKDETGRTIQLHLKHENGITGLVECSTQFSWNATKECMQVNCRRETIDLHYPVLAAGEKKALRIMNLPAERIMNQPVITKQYFSANNFILPVAELNTIYLQGFLPEIESFVKIVENETGGALINDLPGLLNLYSIFDKVRSHENY
jgi:virulence factor